MAYTLHAEPISNSAGVPKGKGEYTNGKIQVTARLDPALVRRANRDILFQALIEQGLRRQLEANV